MTTSEQSESERVKDDLTLEYAQEALVHLAELVAAFAGGGVEILDSPDLKAADTWQRDPDEGAKKCLTRVVQLLLAHREEQRDRQRVNIALDLGQELADVYARTKAAPDSVDLDAEVNAVLERLGFEPDEEALLAFVPALHELSKSPKDFAAELVAPFMGVEKRTFYNRQSRRNRLEVRRTAFGHWVPLRLARRYCDEVFEVALTNRDLAPLPRIADLKDLTLPFAALLERRTEEEFRRTIDDMFRTAFLGDFNPTVLPEGARARAQELLAAAAKLRSGFRARVVEQRSAAGEPEDNLAVDERAEAEYRAFIDRSVEIELQALGLA